MTGIHSQNVVVIVGGGIIGLSTAYNIGKRNPEMKIKVLKAFDQTFTAASSTCTGCIHYGFSGDLEPLISLGKYSFDLWAEEAQSAEFRQASGYRPQPCFGLKPGSGQGLHLLPDWVDHQSCWDVDNEVLGANTAMVNPVGIGEWLTKQCLGFDVEIHTGVQVVGVILSPDSKVEAVTCLQGSGQDKCVTHVMCKHLVLACGPWTPTIFQTLFPSSPIHLSWTTDAGDWTWAPGNS